MHGRLGSRWTNGEDDLHLNEDIRSLVEDLEVKIRVQVTKEKKPRWSTNEKMKEGQLHQQHQSWPVLHRLHHRSGHAESMQRGFSSQEHRSHRFASVTGSREGYDGWRRAQRAPVITGGTPVTSISNGQFWQRLMASRRGGIGRVQCKHHGNRCSRRKLQFATNG